MNQDAFDRFMTEQLGWIPVKALARQLMLFESEVAGLVKDVPGRDTKRHFNKTVRTPQFAPKILKRSAKVADRMMAHLAAAGVTHGDAIMLVDIGYHGTVQIMPEPLFAARMNLTVAGRYLFLREESLSGREQPGFLHVRPYHCSTVHALSKKSTRLKSSH